MSKIDTKELNLVQHNLDKYLDELDDIINNTAIIICILIWYFDVNVSKITFQKFLPKRRPSPPCKGNEGIKL